MVLERNGLMVLERNGLMVLERTRAFGARTDGRPSGADFGKPPALVGE
jgi:hypothetical protein